MSQSWTVVMFMFVDLTPKSDHQTALVKEQSLKMWIMVSPSWRQVGQATSLTIFLFLRLTLVANASFVSKLPPLLPTWASLLIKWESSYRLRKTPLFAGNQSEESSLSFDGGGRRRIWCTSSGRKVCLILLTFHLVKRGSVR